MLLIAYAVALKKLIPIMSYRALDRAEIKLRWTAFCHQAKLEMCCGISVKTKNAYIQRQWACDSSFCRSFALVFAHVPLQKWSDCSHYTCGKCFCSVSFLICHASRALRGPTIFPSVLIRCIPLIYPFSFASLFPTCPSYPCLNFIRQINRGTCCDWTIQWKVNFNLSD